MYVRVESDDRVLLFKTLNRVDVPYVTQPPNNIKTLLHADTYIAIFGTSIDKWKVNDYIQ